MTAGPHVLVVDDRAEARTLIAGDLEEAGFRVQQARDGEEAWRSFRRSEPALVVTDLRMPRADGVELLGRIRSVSDVPVIVLTAHADVPTAVAAMKGGAQEFLGFPEGLERLVGRVQELVPADPATGAALEQRLVGGSPSMERVRERIRALAPLPVPVLVAGEPGTGRDSVALALHAAGPHAGAPLVKVGAGERPPARLPESGAVYYLDGIDRLESDVQAHWRELVLSRERAEGQRVLRILASTSADLAERAKAGSFEPALAEHLLRFTIALAPLRERAADIPALVDGLAGRLGRDLGRGRVRFEASALSLLEAQRWPGNVRDLAAVIEKLVAFSPDGCITRARVRDVLGETPDSVALLRSRRLAQEREELVGLLEACGGNLAEVARRLGISRGAVIYRAQKHALIPKPR
jgi:DNA-binding NtrC family response regulator